MKQLAGDRRASRVRRRVKSTGRVRLTVFRSSQHIYAQVIDDVRGHTLAAASSIEKSARDGGTKGTGKDGAAAIGKLIAERAIAAGVKEVVFDRGKYLFHGRVKALADAAREGGLNF